jgi:DNA-binding NtrC family response regulator
MHRDTGRPTVMIVEDDADIRETLTALLESRGFAVMTAENGPDAIELLDRVGHPCVILVDLLMPGINGMELLEVLGSEDRLAAIPVAVVSGSPELAPPGYKVFRKPLGLEAIVEFVAEGCALQAARREGREPPPARR